MTPLRVAGTLLSHRTPLFLRSTRALSTTARFADKSAVDQAKEAGQKAYDAAADAAQKGADAVGISTPLVWLSWDAPR